MYLILAVCQCENLGIVHACVRTEDHGNSNYLVWQLAPRVQAIKDCPIDG